MTRSTVTFVTVPDNPATAIFDGYGEPAALSLIVIAAGFENAVPPQGDPVGVGVAEFVRVAVTVAVFVGVPLGEAVAVNVGEGDAVAVAVGVPQAVVSVTVHPPLIVPTSAPRSSLTHRCHVPFGSVPLNTDIATVTPGAGAGAGNTSDVVS